ncbi:Zn-ribbon domain-containing OB-fold protein [Siccirubricoccus phaeus]|uniref:Zn-ribbon domain-containing OB-fold protein n=1 Tax=Siccirubricoccus phaeus TaxID=2595053 RepID=UPI0011F0B686|nr:OB-fold domain-containing protein [Siccirubricoccus phaeus]
MAAKERAIPAPMTNPETEPFWEAAKQGKFLLPWCVETNKAFWYPRAVSPFALNGKVEWREASGRGTIYSVSVMKRAPEVYAIAYVTVEEGPTMMTNIVECDFDKVAIGDKVQLTWRPTEDGPPYPVFKPAA